MNGNLIAPNQPERYPVCNLSQGSHKVPVGNFDPHVNFGGEDEEPGGSPNSGWTVYLKAEPCIGLVVGAITQTELVENRVRRIQPA